MTRIAPAADRTTWIVAALVPLMAIGAVILESRLIGVDRPVFETATAHLDLEAVAAIEQDGLSLCGEGPSAVPLEYADRLTVMCEPVDGHGGAGYVLGTTAIAALGAWIFTRFSNRAGALVTAVVALDVAGAFLGAHALRAMAEDWPGVVATGLGATVVPVVVLVLLVPALLLHVPTGRLRSPRWRWGLAAAAAVALFLALVTLIHPLVLGSVLNPIGAPWPVETADSLLGVGWTAWLTVLAIAAASLLWRLADGVRWLGARRQKPADTGLASAVASRRGSGK